MSRLQTKFSRESQTRPHFSYQLPLVCFCVLLSFLGGVRGEPKEEPNYTIITPAYHPTLADYTVCLTLLPACQFMKSRPSMKNFRPIWTIGMRSSSMILRKCRSEKPAISAAVGISKNILMRG